MNQLPANPMVQEQILGTIAKTIEKNLDDQIERLQNLDVDDIEVIRQQRLNEMKKREQLKQEWRANGHGSYSELPDEKAFFTACNKSSRLLVHFYTNDTERCKILDMHLKTLANKHIETKFVKIDAEKSPFLAERLRIKMIPTLAMIREQKAVDYLVGFTELGNCDDFSTDMLEWRLARSDMLDYNGDLTEPPMGPKKANILARNVKSKTIRETESGDSDLDFSD